MATWPIKGSAKFHIICHHKSDYTKWYRVQVRWSHKLGLVHSHQFDSYDDARAFAARINAHGAIDPSHWTQFTGAQLALLFN